MNKGVEMEKEMDFQEMPDPVQGDLESCVETFSVEVCLSLFNDIMDLEPA